MFNPSKDLPSIEFRRINRRLPSLILTYTEALAASFKEVLAAFDCSIGFEESQISADNPGGRIATPEDLIVRLQHMLGDIILRDNAYIFLGFLEKKESGRLLGHTICSPLIGQTPEPVWHWNFNRAEHESEQLRILDFLQQLRVTMQVILFGYSCGVTVHDPRRFGQEFFGDRRSGKAPVQQQLFPVCENSDVVMSDGDLVGLLSWWLQPDLTFDLEILGPNGCRLRNGPIDSRRDLQDTLDLISSQYFIDNVKNDRCRIRFHCHGNFSVKIWRELRIFESSLGQWRPTQAAMRIPAEIAPHLEYYSQSMLRYSIERVKRIVALSRQREMKEADVLVKEDAAEFRDGPFQKGDLRILKAVK